MTTNTISSVKIKATHVDVDVDVDHDNKQTHSSTMVKSGHCKAGKSFQNHTDTIKIYYEIHGNGPNKLLFIMGLNHTSEAWENQTKHFGNHPDYQVCVFDNRGVGYSDALQGLYSTRQMAYDVVDLCEHIGWTNNIHLIGVSMGGMIAQELVLAKPQYFKSLCLTSTSPGMSLPPLLCVTTLSKLFFMRNPLEKVEIIVRLTYPKEWLEAPAPPGSPHATNEKHVLDKFIQRITKHGVQPVSGVIGQLSACLRHYCSPDRLRRIKHYISQILVVTGSWDNLIRPENSYYLAEQLNADFEYWEGSGHALPGEQVERYNNLLDVHFRKAGLVDTNH